MTKRRVNASRGKQALVREAAKRKHAREFARMNERRAPKLAPPPTVVEQPRYLAERARGLLRRLVHMAIAPLSLARALVEHFRDRQLRES